MSLLTYRLPQSLSGDIDKFVTLAGRYVRGEVSATEFKAYRVPMGVYEQRRDDVYMVRIRATGGLMGASQLRQLLDIAREAGSDLLHITTRQEIQIQNLKLQAVAPALRRLQAIGLASKGGGGNTIRNIMISERSGIYGPETFDTTPYAIELTSRMVAEPDSYLMPRKVKIAFSSDEHEIDYAAINDIGLIAKVDAAGHRGFRVFAGGGAGNKPSVGWELYPFLPAEDLYALVRGVKTFFSAHGNRKVRSQARIRFIFYKLGVDETLALIRRYVDEARAAGAQPLEVKPLPDERPPYAYEAPADVPAPDDEAYSRWRYRYVLPQRQEGYYTVLLPFVLGNVWLTPERTAVYERLLDFVRQFGEQTLRFTNTQNIRLRNIPASALPELFTIVKPLRDETGVPLVVSNIVSCTGADTCRQGIALSKGLAGAIRRALLASHLDLDRLAKVAIHVTGCPNSCGQQLWADLGFAGRVLRNDHIYPGYQVYLGANRTDAPAFAHPVGNLSARDVPQFVVRLFDHYLTTAPEGQPFADYLAAGGEAKARELLAEYKTIPSFADDKNYYFDWGAEELFSVAARGKAECAAGLFDMIKVDQDTIARAIAHLDEGAAALKAAQAGAPTAEGSPAPLTAQERADLVRKIVFAASRMLLVTRGLDPTNEGEVYDAFVRLFIDEGYVDPRLKPLILKAKADPTADLSDREADARDLADAVNELYKGMDDSMQFKKAAPATGTTARPQATKEQPARPSATPTPSASPAVKAADSAPAASAPQPAAPSTPAASAPAAAEPAIDRTKDLRGIACPMNFVKTKLELATMQPGQVLEIFLDDGQPIENVPGSVRQEGNAVLIQEPVDDYWRVVIRKK